MLQMLHFIGSLGGRWRVKCTGTKHKEVAMLKNKLILAAVGLAISAPVLADHGHRGYDRRVVVHERYVVQRPVVVREYYRPAPRPVYVVQPAPVYHHSNAGPALVVGAILGAAIVHSVITSGY
jgi:hypothetical protein